MIVYGKSGVSFAKELYYDPSGKNPDKTSNWETAKKEGFQLVDHFLGTFTGLRKWLEDTKRFAEEYGYVETMFGRQRRLPDLNSEIRSIKADAERQAINAPIQGTGSDLTLLSLIHITNWLAANKMKSMIIATVHDSIVFDVYLPELPVLSTQVKAIMENVHKPYITTQIPILIDLELGSNYGDTSDIDIDNCAAIHDTNSFKEWMKITNLAKYKKEIKYLKQKAKYSMVDVIRYLKQNGILYPSLVPYIEAVFFEMG